jgi:hypothetical protein
MISKKPGFILFLLFAVAACNNANNKGATSLNGADSISYQKGSFGYDLDFLKRHHKDLVLLGDTNAGPQVIVLPAYQARVMTSTAEGKPGQSFGWVNHELIASGKTVEHINVFGGEERFWLGPEGGQFSIYFKKGAEFVFDNWFVPKELDTEPFELISSNMHEAHFEKNMSFENYSGTKLNLRVNRSIRLLGKKNIDSLLGAELPEGIEYVGFESDNAITNTGNEAWTKKSGMLSIWILSMLNASDSTVVVAPYKKQASGPIVTDDYFGKVPADRLKVNDGLILFKADAKHRSKIGISPERALPIMASYDAAKNVLTLAQYSLHEGVTEYVNSLWKLQDNPYKGDAANAYNDGPIDGKQLGRFYEIESSSPAAALLPGKSIRHIHRTIHLRGSKEKINQVAKRVLGVEVDDIKL